MQEIYGSTASVQASDIRALETRLAEKYKDVLKLSGNGKVPVLYLVPYADYGAFKLDSIEIKEELQGQGWGSKILKEICDFADQNNLIIVLTPAEKKTAKLVKWYKSFGFLENKGRNKDFRWSIRMIRYPHGLTRSKWIDANQATANNDYEEVERIRLKCYPGIDKEYFHNTLNKLITEREMESFVGKHNDQGESLKGIQNSYRYLQGNRPAEVDKGLQNYGSDFDMGTNVFAGEQATNEKRELKFTLSTEPGYRKAMIDMLEDLSNVGMVHIGRVYKYNTPGKSHLEVHVKEANEKAYKEIKAYLSGYLELDSAVEIEVDETFTTNKPSTVATTSFEEALKKVKEDYKNGVYSGYIDPTKNEDELRKDLEGLARSTIYRGVRLDHENKLNKKDIGIYWTWDRNKVSTYWGDRSKTLVTLEGIATDENIDWHATIEHWIHPRGNGECEVRLKPKSKIDIGAVWVKNLKKHKKFSAIAYAEAVYPHSDKVTKPTIDKGMII